MKDRIEAGFERWGRLLVRYRWLVIAATLALTLGLGSQLPRLAMDNSVEGFLHDDDPTLIRYNEFRDQFGRDDVTIIAIETPDVFDLGFLEKLRALHEDLEAEVPHLDEITSLINARSTRGEGDALIVEDLLEDWPRDTQRLTLLRERVFANPLYLDTLISADGHITTVTIKPDTYSPLGDGEALTGFDDAGGGGGEGAEPTYLTDVENAALVRAVREVLDRHEGPGFEAHLAGVAVVEERVVDEMQADLARFLSASAAIIVLVLFAVFRRVAGVLLPLVTVALSLVVTVGLMVPLDIPLSLTTEVMPPFLLTVGVCYSVHLLAIFFQRLDAGASREDAIAAALGHSGLAIVMTSLTTAGGLVSFAWAEVAQVSELGVVAPIGVMLALVFSLVLLPALLAVTPLRGAQARAQPRIRLLMRLVVGAGALSARRPWTVVAASAFVLALAGVGAARLRFANDYFLWFPEDAPLRVATDIVDRELRGVVTLEAIVDTGEVNGLHRPELMRRFEEIAASNASIQHGELFIGKTVSIADVLKETHQALNENRPEFYTIPGDRRLIAQELLLFENSGSDDLEELVDSQFRTARISMKIPWADWMLYPDFLAKVQRHIEAIAGNQVKVTLTGFSALMARAASTLNLTLARSYVIALLIITPLMIFLLGGLGRGLLSMAPNLAPVLTTLGVMGWLDIPLDMSTLLIGGVVIGLAVDDTIHFMHGFNRRVAETGDPYRAVRETLATTGTAMLFTTVVLAAGFFVFTLAYMANIAAFGLLCGVATVIAFLADVTLAPALMILVTRRHDGQTGARGRHPPTENGAG
jgi:predicted RND superfamily exporter protein